MIELKDDNADATEQVLRHLYGFELPRHSERSWRFWLDLMITANKYLEPQLSTSAERKFRAVAEDSLDADAVLDVYQSIKSDLAHHDGLIEFAETLRKDNLLKLQKNKRYQGLLSDDPDLLASHFEILDQLGLSQDMVQKRIHVCDWHSEQVLKTPDYGWAACCFNNCLYPHVSGRNVFLPKSG